MDALQAAATPAKILGGKGKKLHAAGMHIRRTENKGYITKHELTDRHGNPPQDGQRASKEYSHANIAELIKHVQDHMGDDPEAEADV